MDGPAVAIYLRLSRDDEREGESASIESQRAYLRQYASGKGWQITKEYVDDGWSGLRFDRPQFQAMLSDVDQGLIDTVLTKDLSRLGRDQIYTAYYYQLYFPRKGVRYIAVSEGLDTAGNETANALFPFLTAANDFYTADVSRKVRAALTARKREGKFIGSQPPLGYRKDPEGSGQLVIDEVAAPVIRRIYRRYIQLGSVTGVAKELTEQGVPTPSQYRGVGVTQKRSPGVWSAEMVRRILTNPTYAGHLTQNRRVKINYKVRKYQNLPPEDWITIPNSHSPIIDQEQFDQVRTMLSLRSYHSGGNGKGHLLTGLVYCADCGAPMTYLKESPTRTYMVCKEYRKGGRLHLCTSHCVREDRVIDTVRAELKRIAQQLDAERLETVCRGEDQTAVYQCRYEKLQRQLEQQKNVMRFLYEDRASERLSQEEFRELFQKARKRRAELEEELRSLSAPTDRTMERNVPGEELRKLLSFEELDRSTVAALIGRVTIHADKSIDIQFRFQQPS